MHQVEHSAILSTFIRLPFSIKTFVLSIFKWPHKTGFTLIQMAFRWQVNSGSLLYNFKEEEDYLPDATRINKKFQMMAIVRE